MLRSLLSVCVLAALPVSSYAAGKAQATPTPVPKPSKPKTVGMWKIKADPLPNSPTDQNASSVAPESYSSGSSDSENHPYLQKVASHQSWKILMRRASDSIDQISKKLEEYGSVAMSAPLLAPPGGNFKFGLAQTPDTFYGDAKKTVEGSAASQVLIQQMFSGGLNVQENPFAASTPASAQPATGASSAPKATTSGAATTTTTSTPSTTTTTTTPSSSDSDVAIKLADLQTSLNNLQSNFKSILPGLQPGQVSSIPDRAAIITAAGDSATQSLLNFLGDPSAAAKFKDQVVYVGVVTVAVNPGWRTKKDFAAQITMTTECVYDNVARRSVLQKIISVDDAARDLDEKSFAAAGAAAVAQAMMDTANQAKDNQIGSPTGLFKDNPDLLAAAQNASTDNASAAAAQRSLIAAISNYFGAKAAKKDPQILDALSNTIVSNRQEAAAQQNTADTSQSGVAIWLNIAGQSITDAATSAQTQLDKNDADVKQAQAALDKANADFRKNPTDDNKKKVDSCQTALDTVTKTQQDQKPLLTAKVANKKTFDSLTADSPLLKTATEAKATAVKAFNDAKAAVRLPKGLVDLARVRLDELDNGKPNNTYEPIGLPPAYTWMRDSNHPVVPEVAGVTPMTDSQVLDLQDQFRRQDALALQLAGALTRANLGAQAKVFEQFVKSRQKEAQTVSNNGVVNTFSASGSLFGFEIGPRLKALEDPASRRGGSGNVLDRLSFPAMIIFGVDQTDILPKAFRHKVLGVDGKPILDPKTCTPIMRWDIAEPAFEITQTTRWKPLTHKLFSWGDFYDPTKWHAPRFSENDRHDIMVEAQDALNGLKNLSENTALKDPDNTYGGSYKLLETRFHNLQYLMNGSEVVIPLPIELDFPDSAVSLKTTADAITPSSVYVDVDGNDVIKSSDGTFKKDVFVIGANLDLLGSVDTKQLTETEINNESGKFKLSAAFSDTKPNANFRKITLTFTPDAQAKKKVPDFVMFNLQLTLDPTKAPPGSSSTPISSPPFALVKRLPDAGLKPVFKNDVASKDGKVLEQTISIDPSASDTTQGNAGNVILHAEDKPSVTLPKDPTKVLIEKKTP